MLPMIGQRGKNGSWEQKNEPTADQHDEVYQQESASEYLVSGKCA